MRLSAIISVVLTASVVLAAAPATQTSESDTSKLGDHNTARTRVESKYSKHVLLVVIDDLGFGDLGYTGSAVKTPVLDALATSGVRLLQYYVQRACSPTRAAIHTGRYNIRYRMESGVLEPGQRFGLALDETLLPTALRHAAGEISETGGQNLSCNITPKLGWNCAGHGIKGYAPLTGANATADSAKCCSHCAAVSHCEVYTIFEGKCYLKTAGCAMHYDGVSKSGGATPPVPPTPPPHSNCPPAPPVVPGTWATHAVGKWHLGFWQWPYTPSFRGYDSYLGYYTGGEDYYTHSTHGVLDIRDDSCPNCGAGCSQPRWDLVGNYSTHVFTAQAESVIAAHNDTQRLFLYLAYQAVHAPTEVPATYVEPYAALPEPRRTFAGMLACADEGVGNVTRALAARGMLEDTVIVVTADNGAPTPSCGGAQGGQNFWPYDNPGSLRGGKCSCWEGGLRGTAFISSSLLPADIRGSKYSGLMHAVDLLPTLLTATHGDEGVTRYVTALQKRGLTLDGVSQWNAILHGEEHPRTEVLLEADPHSLPWEREYCGDQHGSGPGTGYYAFRRGDMKIILGDPAGGEGDGWYCTGLPCDTIGWTSSPTTLNASSVQLYDVVTDPGEHHNLALEQPETVKVLLSALLTLNATAEPSYVCGPDGPWQVNGTLSPFG